MEVNSFSLLAPGTWKQILPAAVTADPASGTIPTGYLILNVTEGTLKRHAGSYDWQTVVGATAGKIGFYGVTPVTRPASADQVAVTLGNTDGEIAGLSFRRRSRELTHPGSERVIHRLGMERRILPFKQRGVFPSSVVELR